MALRLVIRNCSVENITRMDQYVQKCYSILVAEFNIVNSGTGAPSSNANAGPAVGNTNGGSIGGPSTIGNPAPAAHTLNPDLIADDAEAVQNSLDLSEAHIPKAIFMLAKSGITN
ncbi:hypothetical protein B0H10DRAFT_1942419 [Mycena sp. CBHHK59/15]|nr:hypothetical protein B0H10DRAFT_1942419 [Mycena sp. CBHHK59/15]